MIFGDGRGKISFMVCKKNDCALFQILYLTRLWTYRDFLQLFFEYGEAVQTCLKEALSSLFCPFFALINDSMAFPFRLRLAFFTAFALYL
jgi:hypothetical protein